MCLSAHYSLATATCEFSNNQILYAVEMNLEKPANILHDRKALAFVSQYKSEQLLEGEESLFFQITEGPAGCTWEKIDK